MIYLDNAATTIPYKNCLLEAQKFNEDCFYNPSALYMGGIDNSKEIKVAREYILSKIGDFNRELIFNSCGSEGDNQAIFGVSCHGKYVTTLGEHSAVFKSYSELRLRGKDVFFVSLNKDGSVNEKELLSYIEENKDKVGFVSIVHVNNETGAINDINSLATKIKAINKNIIFHSDGVQAYAKLPHYKIGKDVDLYSISAHKINAIKGVGALLKRKNLGVKPLIFGGGQENNYRSGTENVFGIKIFHYASIEHFNNIEQNFNTVKELKQYCIDNLDKNIFTIISGENSSPYILSVSAVKLRGEVIMHALENYNIVVGNGSACSSKNRYSRVLEACGYKNDVLDGVIRISFCPENTLEEVKFAVEKLNEITNKLKGIMK